MDLQEKKSVSLSWLIISTRDYKEEYDWFWDKLHHCCYGLLKEEKTDRVRKDLRDHYKDDSQSEMYYDECVLMPELQMYDVERAKEYLIEWCVENGIEYRDDVEDEFLIVQACYWGYGDEGYEKL